MGVAIGNVSDVPGAERLAAQVVPAFARPRRLAFRNSRNYISASPPAGKPDGGEERRVNPFQRKNGELYAEDVRVADIADEVGTPCYLYSRAALVERYREYDDGFGSAPHLVCYSVKANSNLAVLRVLARLGSGFDVVSGGELARVLRAGGDPKKVVFSGVGKQAREIREALEAGILMFNVESPAEIDLIDAVARDMGRRAPVALRVNPDVDPKTHPYISTGLRTSKFGIAIERCYRGLRARLEASRHRGRRRRLPHRLAAHLDRSVRRGGRAHDAARGPALRGRHSRALPRRRRRAWESRTTTRSRRPRATTRRRSSRGWATASSRSSSSPAARSSATRASSSRACCSTRARPRRTSSSWMRR
jgi:hypothetical protein